MPRGTYKTSRLDKERRRDARQSGDDFLKLAEQLNINRNLTIPLCIHVSLGEAFINGMPIKMKRFMTQPEHMPEKELCTEVSSSLIVDPPLSMIQRLMRSVIFLQNFQQDYTNCSKHRIH